MLRGVWSHSWRLPVAAYLPVFIYLTLIVAFAVVSLGAAFVLRPARPYFSKLGNYARGAEPIGDAGAQFPVGFYLAALLFVAFGAPSSRPCPRPPVPLTSGPRATDDR